MICDYRWCDEVGGLDAAVAVPADGRYSNKRLGLDRRNLDFRIIVNSLADDPITGGSPISVYQRTALSVDPRNEGTIVPSFRPLFDFRGTLRDFFALRSWRPLPSCGRGIERNRENNAVARQKSQGVLSGNSRQKTWARYGHNNGSQVCLFVSNGAIHCPAFL